MNNTGIFTFIVIFITSDYTNTTLYKYFLSQLRIHKKIRMIIQQFPDVKI